MAQEDVSLSEQQEITLSGDLADFTVISRPIPQEKSFYLALGVAIMQSLIRLKPTKYHPQFLGLFKQCSDSAQALATRFGYQDHYTKFTRAIELFLGTDRKQGLEWLKIMMQKNHQGAAVAFEKGMRCLVADIIGKDHEYANILNNFFDISSKEFYLDNICNRLKIHIMIVSQNTQKFTSRTDKNQGPLLTLYLDSNYWYSVMYHREALIIDNTGSQMTDSLEKFPFIYDPRLNQSSATPNAPTAFNFAPTAQIIGNGVGIRPSLEVDRPKIVQSLRSKDELLSELAKIISAYLPTYKDENLLRLINQNIEEDQSLLSTHVSRLKDILISQSPQFSNQTSCNHKRESFKPNCGYEHCIFCLKEKIDAEMSEGRKVFICEHGAEISPKNIRAIVEAFDKASSKPNIPKINVLPQNIGMNRNQINESYDKQADPPSIPLINKQYPGNTQYNAPMQGGNAKPSSITTNLASQAPYPVMPTIPKVANIESQQTYKDIPQNIPKINPYNYQPEPTAPKIPNNLYAPQINQKISSDYMQPASYPQHQPANLQRQYQDPNQGQLKNGMPQQANLQRQYQAPNQSPPRKGIIPQANGLAKNNPYQHPAPNLRQCQECKQNKPPGDFDDWVTCINCKVCVECRASENRNTCLKCDRYYSENELMMLGVYRSSLG